MLRIKKVHKEPSKLSEFLISPVAFLFGDVWLARLFLEIINDKFINLISKGMISDLGTRDFVPVCSVRSSGPE